ncbi:hypothetical protein C8Q79DRAFT_245926 [Trametes meyenii]|nr:hypothetical protein C8Q79DRAFT_245926 [Trametes meyenii]
MENLILHARAHVGELKNRQHPLHRAPPEILSHIFSLVPEDVEGAEAGDPTWAPWTETGTPRALHSLILVCHHWYNIITGTPSLWSTISESDADAKPNFPHYIDRCTSGPLYVHLNGRLHESTLGLLRRVGPRIRDLFHEGSESTFAQTSFPADGLRRCKLNLGHEGYTGPPLVPLFQGYAPNIRVLQLDKVTYLPSTPFPSLVHLALGFAVVGKASFTFQDVRRFLLGHPKLQSLHLKCLAIPGVEVGSAALSETRISLRFPHLRRFSLVDACHQEWRIEQQTPIPYSQVLKTIAFPDSCLVHVGPVTYHDLQTLTPRLIGDSDWSYMRIVGPDRYYSRCLSIQLTNPSRGQGVYIDAQQEYDEGFERTIPWSLLAGSGIRELWADSGSATFFCPPRIPTLLSILPQLRVAQVFYDSKESHRMKDVITTFMTPVGDDSVVCPELQTLWFHFPGPVVEWMDTIRSVLLYRRTRLCRPLQRLFFSFYEGWSGAWLELGASGSLPNPIAGLEELVGELLIFYNDGIPPSAPGQDDLLWNNKLPLGCRAHMKLSGFWPSWERR